MAMRAAPRRRMLVSESACKLAEARREFLLKHENKAPDRSKLTMYDLIYYNPVTNPMTKPREVTRRISSCLSEEPQDEEVEDDPPSSSGMPVPQVKVGPDGQLIIDEQSIVIEQTNAKRKEMLLKEAIIDDDNTGSGFYKRRQKSKEWPKWETLKFYKALNTVGTDFLLMQSLFPKRTRQEIKLKFKKEEKVNRHLVEKALAYHQEFDTDILEKSLASFDDSEREYMNAQESKGRKKRGHSERRRRNRIVATSIGEIDASDEDDPTEKSTTESSKQSEDNNNRLGTETKKSKSVSKRSKLDEDVPRSPSLLEDDRDSSSSSSSSDTDNEIYHVRPTRSGRQPKVKRLQGPDLSTMEEPNSIIGEPNSIIEEPNSIMEESNNTTEETVSDNNETEAIKSVIPDIGQVEPGSLVILSKESPEEPGKSVLQVYMVSKNIETEVEPSITPVDLSPELLATVTTKISGIEPLETKEMTE